MGTQPASPGSGSLGVVSHVNVQIIKQIFTKLAPVLTPGRDLELSDHRNEFTDSGQQCRGVKQFLESHHRPNDQARESYKSL